MGGIADDILREHGLTVDAVRSHVLAVLMSEHVAPKSKR